VAGGRDKKEETFWMPVVTRDHCLAFNHRDYIISFIGSFENAVIAVQLIKGNVENALRWARIHGKRLEHLAPGSQVKIRLVTRDIRGGLR